MKELLIKLLSEVEFGVNKTTLADKHDKQVIEEIAEKLLANGVILPPCKIGDDLWWVYEDGDDMHVELARDGVRGIAWDGKKFSVIDTSGDILEIGSRFACLTKEQAKQVMKKMKEEKHENND